MPQIKNWPRKRRNQNETVWVHSDLPIRVVTFPWGTEHGDWIAEAEVYDGTDPLNAGTKEPEEQHRVEIKVSNKDLSPSKSREQVEDAARQWMRNNPDGGRLEGLAYQDDEVLDVFWDVVDDRAKANAAMTWSTPSDMDREKHGDDLKIVAEFGNHYATNGDPVTNRPDLNDEYEKVDGGGAIPVTETQVSTHFVTEEVADELGMGVDEVDEVLERNDIGSEVYPTVSGRTTYYVKR